MILNIDGDVLRLSYNIVFFDLSLFYRGPRQPPQLGVDLQTILVAESKAATNGLSSSLHSIHLATISQMSTLEAPFFKKYAIEILGGNQLTGGAY